MRGKATSASATRTFPFRPPPLVFCGTVPIVKVPSSFCPNHVALWDILPVPVSTAKADIFIRNRNDLIQLDISTAIGIKPFIFFLKVPTQLRQRLPSFRSFPGFAEPTCPFQSQGQDDGRQGAEKESAGGDAEKGQRRLKERISGMGMGIPKQKGKGCGKVGGRRKPDDDKQTGKRTCQSGAIGFGLILVTTL